MIYLTLPWVVSGATIVFLISCAVYNRRTGYRRRRVEETGVDDALELLGAVRASMVEGQAGPSAAHESEAHSVAGPLLRLNAALLGGKRATRVETPDMAAPAANDAQTQEVNVQK